MYIREIQINNVSAFEPVHTNHNVCALVYMRIAMLHISKASLTPIGLDCLYITYTCIYMHMYMYWAASVAQLVKQLPSMQYVAGLNPI